MLPSLGLLGRLVAIVLLTVLIEAGISTAFYERANQYAVRDDEARRLAEHLVISRRLVADEPPAERAEEARELTTDRYLIAWDRALPSPPPQTADAAAIRQQIVAWEPSLAATDLRLRQTSPGRRSVIEGGLRLVDGSWMHFRTLHPVAGPQVSLERILLALVPAIGLILIAGLLVRRALFPLRRLAQAADRIGIGGDEQVPEGGTGEVRRLVAAFNRMQARIRRLIDDRTQSLAAVGHDLRTPLARLRLRAEQIERADIREPIERDVEEMDAMVASLLVYLGGGGTEPRVAVDVAILCATLVDDATDRGARAAYVGPDHLERELMPSGLKRAVGNLVDNALHYGERVTVTLEDRGSAILIRVEDDGPGIPADQLDAVRQPFVRLDPARRRDTIGFGLGLAIVAQAVEAHGGTLTLRNRDVGGLCAEIELPSG